ncbi:hypothetical protein I4U23_023533 [Adineta vaga]|nr:hypothetical protein I4U23_023533 [Adineta vaga]
MRHVIIDFECSMKKDDMEQNCLSPVDNSKEELEGDSSIRTALIGSDLRKYLINTQNLLNDIDDCDPFVILFFLDCCRIYYLRHIDSQRNSMRAIETDHIHGLKSMPVKVGSSIAFLL